MIYSERDFDTVKYEDVIKTVEDYIKNMSTSKWSYDNGNTIFESCNIIKKLADEGLPKVLLATKSNDNQEAQVAKALIYFYHKIKGEIL